MRFYLTFIILVTFVLTSFTTGKRRSIPTELVCALSADKKVYKSGELPKLTIAITNNGKEDIYLIGSLDGSDVSWRFPHCYFSVSGPKPHADRFGRCGNMNTLRIADFRLVKPGQKFDPYESNEDSGFFSDFMTTNQKTFQAPGLYKIKFHYSTNSANISDFIGDPPFRDEGGDSTTIKSLFEKVPKLEMESNELVITVEK